MCEGWLHAPHAAALPVKRGRADLIEAIFLLRSYRTPPPALGYAEHVDTSQMAVGRCISATCEDLPAGPASRIPISPSTTAARHEAAALLIGWLVVCATDGRRNR